MIVYSGNDGFLYIEENSRKGKVSQSDITALNSLITVTLEQIILNTEHAIQNTNIPNKHLGSIESHQTCNGRMA